MFRRASGIINKSPSLKGIHSYKASHYLVAQNRKAMARGYKIDDQQGIYFITCICLISGNFEFRSETGYYWWIPDALRNIRNSARYKN